MQGIIALLDSHLHCFGSDIPKVRFSMHGTGERPMSTQQVSSKIRFVVSDGKDCITQPTILILPDQTSASFLLWKQYSHDVTKCLIIKLPRASLPIYIFTKFYLYFCINSDTIQNCFWKIELIFPLGKTTCKHLTSLEYIRKETNILKIIQWFWKSMAAKKNYVFKNASLNIKIIVLFEVIEYFIHNYITPAWILKHLTFL